MKKTARKTTKKTTRRSTTKSSPVRAQIAEPSMFIQIGVVIIIIAAIALAYYSGMSTPR